MSGGWATGQRHQPSPEGFMVARTERSPGFGTPLAFPVSQWRAEWRAWPMMARYPLQWRGRAGVAPASELPRSCSFSFSAAASLSALPPGRKGSLELGSDPGSLGEI
jgi:hypothetical protein